MVGRDTPGSNGRRGPWRDRSDSNPAGTEMANPHDPSVSNGLLAGWNANDPGLLPPGAATQTLGPAMSTPTNEARPWTRERYLMEFGDLLRRMREITTKKNHDYGSENDPFKNFRMFEELGILVRMSDKFARLRTALYEKREFQVADETVEDTALDLAIYSLLLICYRRGS